jgi:hypothetical protein
LLAFVTPLIEAYKKEHPPTHKKEYWQNELELLGIESKRQSELNDGDELEALAENIKQVYYQDYKSAYDEYSGSKKELECDFSLSVCRRRQVQQH